MNAQKRMGNPGTLSLPPHPRQPRGFQGATALAITATKDGGLLLQKHRATCNICGGTYEVVNFKGFDICRECFLGIREEVERVHG